MKFKDPFSIHKSYQKARLIVLIILIITVLSFTIGYSANLSTILRSIGHVAINVPEGELEITSITKKTSSNATDKGSSFYVENGNTDEEKVLVADLNIDFYRSGGSSTMSITYSIVIENNTLHTQTLTLLDSTPTFTSGSSQITYTINGVNTGTTVLEPGESVTANIVFLLGTNSKNTHYIVNEIFKFTFTANATDNLAFSSILETNEVTFEDNSSVEKIKVYVLNESSAEVTYNFSLDSSNFDVVDENGSSLSNFTIQANSEEEIALYLKVASEHIFTNNSEKVNLKLGTTSPVILTYDLGEININVPVEGSTKILQNAEVNNDSSIDFTSTSNTSGLYLNSTNNEYTYFYRGNVTDNYVSFAGKIWRIIRVDKYGTRVILDSVISETAAWASSNTVSSLQTAISTLSYTNSPVKVVLDNWYEEELADYSDLIKPSLFCEDFSYQVLTSSGSGYETYYFGSYVRNGPDSSGYTPEFVCDDEYTVKYNIGLISGDEISFAGGLFNTATKNYYLYNSSITSTWWSLSPSYYDTSLKTVGIMVVTGSNGRFNDWQNASTIANLNAIRPVITLDTDRLSGGDGTSSSPYVFS